MAVKEKAGMPSCICNIIVVVCFLLIGPAAYYMPAQWAGENGLLEIVQYIALVSDAVFCLYCFGKTKGKPFHWMWLAAAGYFVLLLGGEIRWLRSFFPFGIGMGQGMVSQSADPLYQYIHGGLSIYATIVLVALIWLVPWKKMTHDIPIPKVYFVILIAAVVCVICGHLGLFFHSYVDRNAAEWTELLAYILQGVLAGWYYKQFRRLS